MNTIIEKIRAEVNRQAKSIDTATGDFAEGRRMEQRHILFFLSDLEKEERPEPYNPVYDEAYLNEKIKKATESWNGVDVDKMLAECRGYDEQPVCEDLEAYAQKVEDYYDVGEERGYLCTHRGDIKNAVLAGAKWQAEHRGSSETPKDLEEAAVEYSAIGYSPFDDPYEKNQQFECSKFAFIDGAKWQKEQMMKEAVVCEAEVCKLADRVWVTPTDAKKLQQDTYNNFKAGDKVRIIICKKED